MSDQFLFMYDPGTGYDEDRVPIAAGSTSEEAIRIGTPRLLLMAAQGGAVAMMHSSGVCIAQPDLPSEQFQKISQLIDAVFAKRVEGREVKP